MQSVEIKAIENGDFDIWFPLWTTGPARPRSPRSPSCSTFRFRLPSRQSRFRLRLRCRRPPPCWPPPSTFSLILNKTDRSTLRAAMEAAFGGSDAARSWAWKTAYDACEATAVLFLRKYGKALFRKAASPA
jgi:hypothetical protein